MITLKTDEDVVILREGGQKLARVLRIISEAVRPGVSAHDLNELGDKLIREDGDRPAFFNYTPSGAKRPYPASVCISLNDEIVHGIPNESLKILKEGDIVTIDAGLVHKDRYVDAAITVPVGKIDASAEKLLQVTKGALNAGIGAVKAGNTTGDIGFAIQKYVEPHGFGIVRELCGHGVGFGVHEDPFVPNYGVKGRGARLKAGMVIAIEPMLNEGGADIKLDKDGYTYRTKDGSRSAHFEHTILVTEKGAVVLTAE
jgi:methionyl aminopeptidase